MFLVNILAVVIVQAEAANRGWLAAWVATVAWLPSIIVTTIAVTALNGHSWDKKVLVVLFVSLGNLLGTKVGQMAGQKVLRRTLGRLLGRGMK